MGCSQFLCPRLTLPGGQRYSNAYFIACVYDPHFYSSQSGQLFTESPTGCYGRDSKCQGVLCTQFQSGGDGEELAEIVSTDKALTYGFYCGESGYRIM